MIDGKKQYIIDGTEYTVVRTSEWYNDETTIEYWLHPGPFGRVSQSEAICTVDDIELGDDDAMPTVLAVKVALNRCSKRALTSRENAEWTLKSIEEQEAHAVQRVHWAKQAHATAVKNLPQAQKRAEEEAVNMAKDVERHENRLAELRVQISDAHVQLQNDSVG